MKSKFLSICAAVAVASLMFACEEPNNGNGNGNGNGGGTGVATFVPNPEPIMRPDVLTPINYIPDTVEGGEDGVSIRVTQKLINNFKFTVSPGANIQSYRLDVYPLTRLYNSIYENMRTSGKNMSKQLSEAEVEDIIRTFIFDDQGAGAYTFSVNNMDDFLRHEFDWMNTSYAQAQVVPDCEYVIAAVGCFDKDGYEQGDLSLCYVRTPYYTLLGEPRVGIDAQTNYTAMQLSYIPNVDCKYFYQWCSNESDLVPFIETYGDKLYADFMRNAVYDATAADDAAGCFFYRDFGLDASSEVPIMATAIGLDINHTPAKEFQSAVFNLLERPIDAAPAEATITINQELVGATTFWLDVEMGANCRAAVMKVYTKEEAEDIKQLSESEQLALAKVIYDDGWGFGNENYKFNTQTGELLGSGYKVSQPWVNCNSDEEYVIVYTAMNQYRQVMPPRFTEVVHTKPIVKDTPELSKEDVKLELTAEGVQNVTIKFTYSFENTSKIHFQYIAGLAEDLGLPTEESGTREEFLNLLYEEGNNDGATNEYGVNVNHWHAEPVGVDVWTDILYPDTKYTIAYVAEDWDGVLGEVKFASAKTDPLIGGDDPQMTITGTYDTAGEPYFAFNMVKDAMQMKTAVCDKESMEKLDELGKLRYQEVVAVFENFVMLNGIEHLAPSTTNKATEMSVALGMAIGGEAGNPIYGPLEHLIYADGEFRTLAYYYPNSVPAAVKSAVQRVRQEVITNHQRSVGYVHASQLPEVESAKPMLSVEEFAKEANLVLIDYQKLSSHPKATGR